MKAKQAAISLAVVLVFCEAIGIIIAWAVAPSSDPNPNNAPITPAIVHGYEFK
jgi:zinc transporter ZupT